MIKNTTLTHELALELLNTRRHQDLVSAATLLSGDQVRQLAPILVAATKYPHGHLATGLVKNLLSVRPEWLNAQSSTGDTALMEAFRWNRLDVVDVLFDAGADHRIQNKDGQTALDLAIDHKGNHRIQEVLVAALLDYRPATRVQKSRALASAAQIGNLGAVRALLQRGADFSVPFPVSPDDDTVLGNALHVAANQQEDGEPAVPKIVALMLASPNCSSALNAGWSNEGFGSPLHCAAFNGNLCVLRLLLDAGAWVNPPTVSSKATTPLMLAAGALEPDCVQTLLAAGADATRVDQEGRNALHHLVLSDRSHADGDFQKKSIQKVLDALLGSGLSAFVKDGAGQTPADLARELDQDWLASALDEAAAAQPEKAARPARKLR